MIWLVGILLAALVLSLALLARERCLHRRRIQEICRRLSAFEADGTPYEPIPREDDWAQLDRSLSQLTRYTTQLQRQSREESRQTAQLIADIAHQWKTPLASLKLYCELSLQQQDDPREHKKLTLIERMESMIEALLRLEKLRAKSYEMQFQDRDLLPLVSEICQELSLHYPRKHFRLPSESFILRVDPYWLREALINVIKNACQHTAEEGNIFISLEIY